MWCCIYFSCTTASGGDEMKEKQYNRENRAGGGKGREKGTAGFWEVEEASVPKEKKDEEERQNMIT